jgi:vacuolar-type H+-ATPase subunit H
MSLSSRNKLDETKDNIRRSIDEARKEIPRYTQPANEYQEQTIQAAREIADNHIESQKEVINSLRSAWLSQMQQTGWLHHNIGSHQDRWLTTIQE